MSPISGRIKSVGAENELMFESEYPVLDESVERLNQKDIEAYIQETKEIGYGLIKKYATWIGFILLGLLVLLFILPSVNAPSRATENPVGGVIKGLIGFAGFSTCYALFRLIRVIYKRIRFVERMNK